MKAAFVAVGLVCVVATASPANAQAVDFWGSGRVVSLTGQCGNSGVSQYSVRHRPPKVGGNENRTAFALFTNFGTAQSYTRPGNIGAALVDVTGASTQAFGGGPFVNQAQMKVTSRAPQKIGAKTRAVTIAGEIVNFNDQAGCNVSYLFNLVR